jgi:hypothetical protein
MPHAAAKPGRGGSEDIKGSSHVHKNLDHPIGTFLYRPGRDVGKRETHEYLQNADFSSIDTHELEHDIQNNWYVVRK